MMEKHQKILEAARRVAAREGSYRTTIQKIADEAGLKSPSLVYWYFKNKKEILQAGMAELSPVLNQLPTMWERIDDPPEEVLFTIGINYLRTFDDPEAKQLFRIFFSEVTRTPEIATAFAEKAVMLLNFLVAYFERQAEIGRLRPHDAQSAARSFIGSFVIYMMGSELFLPMRAGLPAKEVYAREVVEIFLRGLRPDAGK
jgi:AcrR family transcriptional regulator